MCMCIKIWPVHPLFTNTLFFGLNRYAVQLLTPSNVLAQINGHESILLDDVKEVDDLFFDAKKSAKHLVDQDSQFIV